MAQISRKSRMNAPLHKELPAGALNDAKALGQGEYEVQGSLRIKGQSLPIKSYVQMTQSQGITWTNGSFRISRLAYKIGAGPWADTSVVADPVDVKYKIAIAGISAL